MQLDATQVTSGETIEAELCIIGAGPAGLVAGAELAARGRDVIVLESGGGGDDSGAQELNEGELVGGPYAGLRATRHRGVGGTSLSWNTAIGAGAGAGAKYVPLDPWDFAPRHDEAPDGWPIAHEALVPYYARAQERCGLGRLDYDTGAPATQPTVVHQARASLEPRAGAPLSGVGESVVSRVYQLGARRALLDPLVATLRASGNARLVTGATVVRLQLARGVVVLTVARRGGEPWTVRARRVVLAAGAVENARLLLLNAASGGGVEDRSGWLGRGFMEHPRDRALTLHLAAGRRYRDLAFYDVHRRGDGAAIVGRLALSEGAVGDGALLNASATLLPIVRPVRARLRGALGARGAVLGRWLPPTGHGWATHAAVERAFDGFTVLLNVEQPPHRDNAIVLGRRRDAFGTPLPVLHWRWHAEDQARLGRVRAVMAGALERAGVGRVSIADAPPDPNAHHHAGTTRMHVNAQGGVVDADGRVHGTESLFVAGASCFPTAGFANPVLTVVALALRLADHLGDGG